MIAFIGLIAILCAFRVYYVSEGEGANLLWNSTEGYLFLQQNTFGYRMNYLQYVGEVIKDSLGGTPNPANSRSSLVVLHITPEGLQRYTAQNLSLSQYTPVDNVVYGNGDGAFWKWTGNRFEQASLEEQRKVNAVADKFKPGFTNVGGWSEHYSILSRGPGKTKFPIRIGGKDITFVSDVGDRKSDVSIQLLRSNGFPETIVHSSETLKRISRTEYEEIFHSR